MSNIFFIGDTHFGHKNILNFEAKYRPFSSIEEHNEELIKRWNSVVGPSDKVYHLGDVVFGRNNFDLLGRLNGAKRLILGNHDYDNLAVLSRYFEKIFGVRVFYKEKLVCTHIPVHPNQFYMGRFVANIHGHVHSNDVITSGKNDGDIDKRYWNVSAEKINLTPIEFSELRDKYK